MPKTALLVSYYFPPSPGAGALRPGRIAKLLPEFGWTVTTLAGPFQPAGFDYGEVIGITPLGDPIASRVPGLWRVAPSAARWYYRALRTALALAAERRFDAVVSVYNPAFTHMIAGAVAQVTHLPWLADYSEAWSGNAMTAPASAISRRSRQHIETRCLRGATAMSAATPGIAGVLAKLHGRSDIDVIENAIDLAEWDRIPEVAPRTFTLLYAGGLFGGILTPDLLFAATAKLRRAGHPAGVAARFAFYCFEDGPLVARSAARYGLQDVVICHAATPRERVLLAERHAAVLLALLPMRAISVMPSKLYEYAGARRPILAAGPAQNRARVGTFIEDNALGLYATTEDECALAICALYERFTNGRYRTDPNPAWSPPTALGMARRFASVLDRISEPSAGPGATAALPVVEHA